MGTTRKTRERMLNVARELFARQGVQRTTMNDIADAAQRGRRTLYTYFKNKEDIFHAIVAEELKHLHREVEIARRLNLRADDKLINLIYVHLEAMKTVVGRNGSLRAEFFRDIWLVEQARVSFDRYEEGVILDILKDGIASGIFVIEYPETTAYLLQNALKGLEVPYISGHARHKGVPAYDKLRESVCHLIFNGIRCTESK